MIEYQVRRLSNRGYGSSGRYRFVEETLDESEARETAEEFGLVLQMADDLDDSQDESTCKNR